MAHSKTVVIPLLTHWSYHGFARFACKPSMWSHRPMHFVPLWSIWTFSFLFLMLLRKWPMETHGVRDIRKNSRSKDRGQGAWKNYSIPFYSKMSLLTHWGRDNMVGILQTTFSNQFSCMKLSYFLFKFHRNNLMCATDDSSTTDILKNNRNITIIVSGITQNEHQYEEIITLTNTNARFI